MKFILILALSFALPASAQTFVSGQVNSCIGVGGGPSTATCAFPSAVGAFHTIIVATNPAASAGNSTVTDTQGNTYRYILNQGGTTNYKMELFYAWTSSSSGNTVQVVNAGGILRAIVSEYDKLTVPDGPISDAQNNVAITLTSSFQANDLVILVGSVFSAGTFSLSPSLGWNFRQGTADGNLYLWDQNLSPSGSYSVIGTATTSPTILGMTGMRLTKPTVMRSIVF